MLNKIKKLKPFSLIDKNKLDKKIRKATILSFFNGLR